MQSGFGGRDHEQREGCAAQHSGAVVVFGAASDSVDRGEDLQCDCVGCVLVEVSGADGDGNPFAGDAVGYDRRAWDER